MNRVKERCAKDGCAKFLFAANSMFTELKYTKLFLYLLNVVPVVICFLPSSDELTKLICSCVSFALTIINEVASALLSNYKEKAILSHQLYEAEITGSSFSKIEYDRESTNDLNELAIRKGLPKMRKLEKYPVSFVPSEITDDYSYLYLCRTSAAKIRYLSSRLFAGYVICLIAIAVTLVGVNFVQATTGQTLYIFICFWPLIIPLIRNCLASRKCVRQCVKICADIDNFFADGDDSVERLARFYYYVQNIEFEMLLTKPIIFKVVEAMCRRGVAVLTDGVTQRFKEAIVELKSRNLILRGVIAQPHGKQLITKTDYDLEKLQKIRKNRSAGLPSKSAGESAVAADTEKKGASATKKKANGVSKAPSVSNKTVVKPAAKKPPVKKVSSKTKSSK